MGDLQDGRRVRCGDHLAPHKYIRNTSTCGTTPTEHLLNAGRRPQTSPNARNYPRIWVGQKKKEKTRDKRIGMGPAPLGGSCEGEKFPHTRKPLRGRRLRVAEGGSFRATEESAATGAEGKAERFPHRGAVLTSTHQPERLVCSPAGVGRGWELRLGLRRSDPRERTGVGCVNTA